jgi:hypothetical protein
MIGWLLVAWLLGCFVQYMDQEFMPQEQGHVGVWLGMGIVGHNQI